MASIETFSYPGRAAAGAERALADGRVEIVDTGRMPWRVAATSVQLSVANPGLDTLIVLDEHGGERERRSVEPGALVTLPENCLYALLVAED